MPPGRRGGRMQYARATLTSVLNSTAQSDQEARTTVVRFFGSLLLLVLVCDVLCAFGMIWIGCSDGKNFNKCLISQIGDGFQFQPFQSSLGDLFLLALARSFLTMGLLWAGVHYGRHKREPSDIRSAPPDEGLTEPLLDSSTSGNDDDHDDDDVASSLETQSFPTRTRTCCSIKRQIEPQTAKNTSLVSLFVASTVFQIYAGLKVSNYHHTTSNNHDELLATFMCLTVLWINAAAYFFRQLLWELTREDGLFLPPQVHRHPVFFEESRSLVMHSCDLCLRRIRSEGTSSGCYRCSLCDFDVCVPCSRRSDAATVGENVLRGDRGVRVEASLDNSSYFRRSLSVARPELPLLLLSFLLLAGSSVSRLLLPHFQGRIIDKVIPNDDGNFDKSGFSYYIKIYVFLMLGQGAISTLYSAIFTLVSRRLKFSIRNSLFDR